MYEFFEFLKAIWILPTFLLVIVSLILLAAIHMPGTTSGDWSHKIKNDSIRHECSDCQKNFIFYIRDLYQQYGNCGGYENGLYVDCPYCRAINQPYKDS